jgi:tryptophan-rich sensory protein
MNYNGVMKMPNYLKLVIALLLPQLAGLVGTFFTTPSIDSWYKSLVRPELAPPNWVFAPVWITLYLLMGIAAYLVWKRGWKKPGVKEGLCLFFSQLVLNSSWSVIFFGLHNPRAAFVEIISLWLAILATLVTFAKTSRPAAWLLLPYLLWVSFAAYLNYSIWILN